ncbi:MAG: DPP IV N-terminal domain-containing protein [Candidatus Hatepunaea meridiana]|nr:DPP IV N-terminal domain-containing protein [Candidatus Hatepunaea meridiana]
MITKDRIFLTFIIVMCFSVSLLAQAPQIGKTLYILPDPDEGAVFGIELTDLMKDKANIKISSDVSAGSAENPPILVSRPLIGISFYLGEGRSIPFGGIEVYINDTPVPYLDELANLSKRGMMFQPIDPFMDGVNVLEAIITDNTGAEGSLKWEIEIRSRIEVDGKTEGLTQLTRTKDRSWNPVFSPDGNLIAYESISHNENNIMVMNQDGSDIHKVMVKSEDVSDSGMELVLDEDSEYAFGLSWMSDSKRLVFTSSRNGNYEIWMADISGPKPSHKMLTDDPGFDGAPDCDPITDNVAFVSNREGNPLIYILDPDKPKKYKKVSPLGGVNLTPRWSPDGKYIAFTRRASKISKYDVYIVQPDGESLMNITPDTKETDDRYPNWSPDATKIAYYSNRSIKIYSFVTGKHTTITNNAKTPEVANGPVWSPDGTRLVYTSNEKDYPVYVADLQEIESGDIAPESYLIISSDLAKMNHELDWSPEFDQLVFRSFTDGYHRLWSLQLDMSERCGGFRVYAPEDTHIKILDETVGYMPDVINRKSYFGCSDFEVGVYPYQLKHSYGKVKNSMVTISAARTQDLEYESPGKKIIDFKAGIRSVLFPGFGQFYRKENFSGYTFSASTLGFLGLGLYNHAILQQDYDDYEAATDYSSMAIARFNLRNREAARNTSISIATGIWAAGVADAFLQPKYPIYLNKEENAKRELLPWDEEYKTNWGTDTDYGALGVVTYHKDSEIWIKGMGDKEYEYYGRCNLGVDFNITFFVPLRVGKYNVKIKPPARKEHNKLVTIEGATRTIVFVGPRAFRDSFGKRLITGLIPGLNQIICQKKFYKAVRIWALQGLSIAGYMAAGSNYNNALDKYDSALRAEDIQSERERAYAASAWKSGFMGLSLGIYFYNIRDAIRSGE